MNLLDTDERRSTRIYPFPGHGGITVVTRYTEKRFSGYLNAAQNGSGVHGMNEKSELVSFIP